MRKNSLFRLWPIVGVISFFFSFFLLFNITTNTLLQATVQTKQSPASSVQFPHKDKEAKSGQLTTYVATLPLHALTPRIWQIIPDDCVESILINGVPLSRSVFDSGRCDYTNGFVFDFSDYLQSGDNTIRIVVKNNGGAGGLSLKPSWESGRFVASSIGFALLLGLWIYPLLRWMGLRRAASGLMLVGLLLRLAYLGYTDYETRSHDLHGHLDYIDHIVEQGDIPAADACWQCYHPPLYPLLAASVRVLLSDVSPLGDYTELQLLSIALMMLFLVYGLKTIDLFGFSRPIRIGLYALLVFFPTGIIHSVRIGNDLLLYPLMAAGFYYLMRWVMQRRIGYQDLYIATLLGATTLFVKTNGIILVATIGVSVLLFGWKQRQYLATLKRPAAILLLIGSVTLAGMVGIKQMRGGDNAIVSNSSGIGGALMVGNQPVNYLYFDTEIFLSHAFTSAWEDGKGRQWFWNYLAKTSLFGEFSFHRPWQANTAQLLSVLFLPLWLVVWAGLLGVTGRESLSLLPVASFFLLSLLAMVALRVMIPAACSNDFRYVFPLIIPMIILVGIFQTHHFRYLPVLRAILWGIVALFPLLSIAFFLLGMR